MVAVLGTYYVQSQKITFLAICASFPVGAFACAILVMNNLRDRAKDLEVGKHTLAVVLGDRPTRILYLSLLMSGVDWCTYCYIKTVGALNYYYSSAKYFLSSKSLKRCRRTRSDSVASTYGLDPTALRIYIFGGTGN